jgi:8-oxo-dGTP pyrophosphatase MutT (NUDIX family)
MNYFCKKADLIMHLEQSHLAVNQNALRVAFYKPLPGLNSQLKMAPKHRTHEIFLLRDKIDMAKKSAVLILLFYDQNVLKMLLIKRSEDTGFHSGQIAFPGGKQEKEDANPLSTALRETEEEIGIQPKDIEIVGELTELYLPPSNFLIRPFVGFCIKRPECVLNPNEVSSIVEVEVSDFLLERNVGWKSFYANSMKEVVEAPYYSVGEVEVWGATAMIISEFLEVIRLK